MKCDCSLNRRHECYAAVLDNIVIYNARSQRNVVRNFKIQIKFEPGLIKNNEIGS